MNKYLIALLLLSNFVFAQGKGETKIVLEKPINANTTFEFGDLHFEKNGKNYWLTTFTSITGPEVDYYRVFEVKQDSGYVKEVTSQLLGGYYPVGGPNPPYYYEDIDNDGIKDIFIFDHGKEEADKLPWSDYNVFFKGGKDGFVKKELPLITTEKQYYHAHDIADFDLDGDMDIAFGYGSNIIFSNNGSGGFTKMNIANLSYSEFMGYQYVINNQKYNQGSFGLKFVNVDADKELELLVPVPDQPAYLDLVNGTWEAKLIGSFKPFQWKDGVHIGVEQVLSFVNPKTKKNDLVYRVASQKFTPTYPTGKWISLYFKSEGSDYSKITQFKGSFVDTATVYYIDPKKADINFYGFDDLVFKEYDYTLYQNYPCCKYYNGSQLHAMNYRLWINNGNNDFVPSSTKFADDANKSVYLLVKSDSKLKYNLFLRTSHVMNFPIDNDYKTKNVQFYTKIDSLIYPKIEKHKITICKGATSKYNPAFVPVGLSIVKSSKLGSISVSNNLLTYTPTSSGSDTIRYHLKNDFFESTDYEIIYNVVNNPAAPTITREGNATLISSSLSGNQWYLDGSIIKGEVGQKINATVNGLYSVKYTDANGCLSENSASLYGLITATGLSDKKVIISPNPFEQSIKIEFPIDFGPMVSAKIHDVKGVIVWEKESVRDSEMVDLSSLSVGNYVLNLTSQTNGQMSVVKISKQAR